MTTFANRPAERMQAPAGRGLAGTIRAMLLSFMVAASALFIAAAPAYAISLDAAKAQGLAGEMANGYVGFPKPPSGEVKQMADGVNLERKAHYSKIADQQGTTLQAVEQLAGAKLVDQAPAGQYVRDSSGSWKQK